MSDGDYSFTLSIRCTTPPQVSKTASCLNRTPRPEDFGVSQSTIKLLENLEKQQHTATKTQPSSTGTNSQTGIPNTQPLSKVACKNPQTSKVSSVNEDDRKTRYFILFQVLYLELLHWVKCLLVINSSVFQWYCDSLYCNHWCL